MRQDHERRNRARGGHAAVRTFEIVARDIAHVRGAAVLGVRRLHLVRVGDADVEAAEVADRVRRGAGIRVVEKAGAAGAARLKQRAVLLFEHMDMRAIAKPDDLLADLHRRRVVGHRRVRRGDRRGEIGHRTLRHDLRVLRNALAPFELPHRIFRDCELAIDRHATQRHVCLRVRRHQFPENPRLEALALGRFKIAQGQLRSRRQFALRTPAIHIEIPRRRNRFLQLRDNLRGQILQNHPRHRLLQRAPRIGDDQRLEFRPPLRGQPQPLRIQTRPARRIRRMPLLRPLVKGDDLPEVSLPRNFQRRRAKVRPRDGCLCSRRRLRRAGGLRRSARRDRRRPCGRCFGGRTQGEKSEQQESTDAGGYGK